MNASDSHSFPLPCRVKRMPAKRCFDLLFSLCAFVFAAPLFLIIAAMIKISSPGRIIYSHERIGRGGRPFPCYKFRTMYGDADKRLKDLLASDPALQKEWKKNFKLKNDPRVTPVGAFLRKTSLDELPQFWNVIRGDLSIVGPRPVVKEEVEKYFGEKAPKILSVRPGLTCLWQVSGRSDTSYAERIALDEQYIDRQTLWLDMTLIAKTIPAMLSSRGAY